MKENTTDYTKSKDAYEGNRETSVYRDSSLPTAKNSIQNIYDDGNIPDADLPGGEGNTNTTSAESYQESDRSHKGDK